MVRLHGLMTALVTPFRGGEIDEKAYERLVDWQIKEGVNGIVVCGTTGESPTLTEDEQDRLIEIAVDVTARRVPVVVGTGSFDTADVIRRTQSATRLGADCALIVTPYYNKPGQEGLYQHFKAVHDSTEIPILLYNIPPRCVVDILPPTMQRLAQLPRIIGVKDSTGDLTRPVRTRLDCGPDFLQFCGDDLTASAFLAQGGIGCISVSGNVAPKLCTQMQDAWRAGDMPRFNELRDVLLPLHQAMFIETNPSPIKYAASLLGFMSDEVRLPMVPCQPTTKAQLAEVMQRVGLIVERAA
ncbi:MAG: 4-hydroxy-tetrahydrodipicolinate synthase [Alphaproteobacteria bacterium]|nr:4-hydroxy-tetrahydrodipicolinate synthase [Alphaproteobacteria bacterium]